MTREKEIKTQAQLYSPNDIGIQAAFEESARWADRTMINKACKWLEQNAYHYCDDIDTLHESALIGDFRYAMKGGEK